MRFLIILPLFLFTIPLIQDANAQGCVAIRGLSCSGGHFGSSINTGKGEFLAQAGFRYFKSFRHFRGSHEEANRVKDGTEVINHSYFLDLSLSYGITNRLYGNAIIPFVYHNRSSLYEHGGNSFGDRHETSSKGLSDIRLGMGYWLFDPQKHHSFNYALGLGIKLPTGKYDYKDYFYNQGPDREVVEGVVDQSIQVGDGGTGFTVDLQGFQMLSPAFMLSANLYYLFNVEETNGVLTRNGRSEFSSPDQFAVRLGAYYNTSVQGFSAYLGGRVEGVPAMDLIGGSAGYRRPGYAVSIEPAISYSKSNYSIDISVPIAISRNRTQSFEDKQRTVQTGVYSQGDAAFADYLISVNFAYRFGGKHSMSGIISPDFKDVKE